MIPRMDLAKVRDALSKRREALFSKRVGFLAVAALALVVGLLIRTGLYFSEPDAEAPATAESPTPPVSETAKSVPEAEAPAPEPATAPTEQEKPAEQAAEQDAADPAAAPSEQAEQTDEAAAQPEPAFEASEQAGQPTPEGAILVAKRPVEVLASPSESAPVAYGFPAGRPFRVIGREGNFAHIQDLTSKASGWIDEAALAPPPAPPKPATAGRTSPRRSTGSKPATPDSQVTAAPEPVETYPVERRRRGGLFGRGGLFDSIFGN